MTVEGKALTAACIMATLIASQAVGASTVVIYFSTADGEIVVAADSRRTDTVVGSNAQPIHSDTTCKIRNFGDLVFASVDAYEFGPFRVESLSQLLNRSNNLSVPLRIALFTQQASVSFFDAKKKAPNAGDIGFIALFAYFDHGVPVVLALRLPSGQLIRYETSRDDFVKAGTIGAIGEIPRETLMDIKMHTGVEDVLSRLVNYEALEAVKRDTLEVGGQTDMIRLTADGAEWVHKKRECRERE